MLKSCEKELLLSLLLHPVSMPNEETLGSEFHLLKCSKQHFLSKPNNSDLETKYSARMTIISILGLLKINNFMFYKRGTALIIF